MICQMFVGSRFAPSLLLALLFLFLLLATTVILPIRADAESTSIDCNKLLTKPDGRRFRIFKEPWVLGKPFERLTPDPEAAIAAWTSRCLEEVDVWYGAVLQPDDKQAPIPFTRLLEHARARPLKSDIRVIDVESWPVQGDIATMAESRAKYTDLFWSVKSLSNSKTVGFYNLPPVPDYWRIKAGPGTGKFKEWQKDNDYFSGLAIAVDAFFPSLYTIFEEDIASWQKISDSKIAEIVRYGQNKPIIPFIMPYYHEGNRKKGGTEINSNFFREQIEYLFDHSDGVIIWTSLEDWNEQNQWWAAVSDFLDARGNKSINSAN
jgi:hypothetical protein